MYFSHQSMHFLQRLENQSIKCKPFGQRTSKECPRNEDFSQRLLDYPASASTLLAIWHSAAKRFLQKTLQVSYYRIFSLGHGLLSAVQVWFFFFLLYCEDKEQQLVRAIAWVLRDESVLMLHQLTVCTMRVGLPCPITFRWTCQHVCLGIHARTGYFKEVYAGNTNIN